MSGKRRSFIFLFNLFLLVHLSFPVCFAGQKDTIKETGEVKVITNPRLPVYKGGMEMSLVFEEELSIGRIEGDENYMFGGAVAFNSDSEGYFYVTDFTNTRILKYSPDGEFILSFGSSGQGPGEFQVMSVVKFNEDGKLYLTDTINRRISFFNKDGEFLDQIVLPERFLDLNIISKGQYVARKWIMAQEDKVMKQISVFGFFGSKFEVNAGIYTDEIETPVPSGRDESSIIQYLANSYSVLAFRPVGCLVLDKKNFTYFGFPDDYEIAVYSPQGEPVKKIKREYEPLRVDKDDREYLLEYMGDALASSANIPQGILKQAMEKIKFPQFKPAFQKFTVMENGWLFVIVDSRVNEKALIDVFDQTGKYIARFESTVPTEGMFFNNGKAYAVATENDFHFVKRYGYKIQENTLKKLAAFPEFPRASVTIQGRR